jgi:hypothetical protein
VAKVAGGNQIVLIMSPRQAASMQVRTDIDYETMSSSVLPDKSISAVATNCLVSVGDAAPDFQASIMPAVNTETVPAPLGTATPTVSMFQKDCITLRMQISLNWVVRDPRGIARIDGVVW